jgi:hypothetical protein
MSHRALSMARMVWTILALVVIGLFVFGLSQQLNQPLKLCAQLSQAPCTEADAAAVLRSAGISISPRLLPTMAFALQNILIPLGYVIVALLIFWRKRDSWLALAASVLLVVYALWANTDVLDQAAARAGWPTFYSTLFVVLDFLLVIVFTVVLYTFPDGRFVPHWTALVGGLAAFFTLLGWGESSLVPEPLSTGLLLLLMGVGLLVQIYRYRRVSTPIERQQTKWALVGLAGLVMNVVLWAMVVEKAVESGAPGLPLTVAYLPIGVMLILSLPISLGISMLRYKLWDIDLIIRRTLVYSMLSALLALVYFGGVVVLQNIFIALTGQAQSQLVTVVSTLAIAALFLPLRSRVQNFIDRRFYRRKYDAARTLAEFGALARDETNLERLSERLLDVVEDTMQPEQISLWLRTGKG